MIIRRISRTLLLLLFLSAATEERRSFFACGAGEPSEFSGGATTNPSRAVERAKNDDGPPDPPPPPPTTFPPPPPPSLFYHPRSELGLDMTSGEEAFRRARDREEEEERRRRRRQDRQRGAERAAVNSKEEEGGRGSAVQPVDEQHDATRAAGGGGNADVWAGGGIPPGVSPALVADTVPLAAPHGVSATTVVDRRTLVNVRNSADAGSVDAAYFLGLFHLYGLESLSPDAEEAERWWRTAAEGGHADAMCALGILLYRGGSEEGTEGGEAAGGASGEGTVRTEEAVRWFRRASEAGHPRGHWLLGRAVYEGRIAAAARPSARTTAAGGVVEEREKGRSRAEEDNPDVGGGGAAVGGRNETTADGPDLAEAARLFALAAEADVPEAIHHLAVMHEYGLVPNGAPAADSDGANAADAHAEAPTTRPPARRDDFRHAVRLYERALRLGYLESAYHLGLLFTYGRNPGGVEPDRTRALDYFRVCAAAARPRPHAGCMRYIGVLLAQGGHGGDYGTGGGVGGPHRRGGGATHEPAAEALWWLERCKAARDPTVGGSCGRDAEVLRDALEKAKAAQEGHRRRALMEGARRPP